MIIDISLHVLLPTCVALPQAAHTFCVCSLCACVFDDTYVLMRVRACLCSPQILLIFICIYFLNAHYLLVSRLTGLHFNMVCINIHVLSIL